MGTMGGEDTGQPLRGRAGLVTGGASGIGRATVIAMVRAGAQVMIGDLDEGGARETIALADGDGSVQFTRTDVTSSGDAQALVNATVQVFGRLDFAHNNAGVDLYDSPHVAEVDPNDWARLISINLSGAMNCLRSELPVMAAAGTGAVVNSASILGLMAIPGDAPYIAAKHGVVGLTRAAALEYGSAGVRVNCVCPGPVDTPMFRAAADAHPGVVELIRRQNPMRRVARPEEIANAVVWLCSDLASYVNGHPLVIDGGQIAGQVPG